MNKWMIDSYVFRVADDRNAVEAELYKYCLDDDRVLRHLMKQIGWDGGTIHQVVDYVMRQKEKWNAGGRLSYKV